MEKSQAPTDYETRKAAASGLHSRQVHYDALHHMKRLVWLRMDRPTWSCGTTVPPHEIREFSAKSTNAIELAMNGISTNSVDLSDGDYLAELDAFGLTQEPKS